MTVRPTIKVSEALLDGINIYYRIFVNGVAKPSLVFVEAPERTVQGESTLERWCEQNLEGLESGKIMDANLATM